MAQRSLTSSLESKEQTIPISLRIWRDQEEPEIGEERVTDDNMDQSVEEPENKSHDQELEKLLNSNNKNKNKKVCGSYSFLEPLRLVGLRSPPIQTLRSVSASLGLSRRSRNGSQAKLLSGCPFAFRLNHESPALSSIYRIPALPPPPETCTAAMRLPTSLLAESAVSDYKTREKRNELCVLSIPPKTEPVNSFHGC
ncbi:hypothetical protein H6P81_016677 [Aristolochia fimbriata]|uniref:Uncharacterized protein n=1 Tax=Aristolochia fimbriata TaxID=158543 RepID=A0AAV7EC71_ARIFI|nr:hypothetical protein H6P81_016677 [Aristolochia fimbriata]